jgi:hypothetical protein
MNRTKKRLDDVKRHVAVAKLVARGYDFNKISEKLNSLGYVTKTGRPIRPQTIAKDLKEIEQEWLKQSTADISRHKARQFHELQKLKEKAWEKADYDLVLKILDKEMMLLGTKITASDKENPKYVKHETNNQQFNILTVDERDEGIAKILEAARERKAKLADSSGASVDATSKTT